MKKCNLADTLYGTILNNAILSWYDNLPQESFARSVMWPLWSIAWLSDWFSVTGSVMEMSYSMSLLMERHDLYNMGKIIGKLFKLYVQMRLKRDHDRRF